MLFFCEKWTSATFVYMICHIEYFTNKKYTKLHIDKTGEKI